jgi:hypothetical protein
MICKNHRLFLLLISLPFLFPGPGFSQRKLQYEQFSRAYFDSIRAMVNDTTEERYRINAYRVSEEIVIDGKLDEAAWKNAERGGGLLEKEPFPLIPMSEVTEFAILYDDENLYIGVWCWDSEPQRIIRQLSPRGTSAPDNIDIFLDSYHDHRTGYKFTVSPTGVQSDELRYDDVKRDSNWNGIWYSAGSVDEHGWYAEIRIPFFNLRYSGAPSQIWGFNIMRSISRDASRGQWKPHLPEWDNPTRMSQMGHIENIHNITSGRTFELRPYLLTGTTETAGLARSNTLSIGGDFRYSPTPNFTADFTLNPDFAQVDADVFEINLTRFPTRFKELRPFFTERTNIFNTPIELFYSRRIGASRDILGGLKATVKLRNGLEVGALGNLTGESLFSTYDQNPEHARYGVFRVKKDILGSSSLGILAATKEEAGQFNRVIGMDGSFILNQNNMLDFQIATGQNEMGHDDNMAYYMSFIRTGDLTGISLNFNRVEPAFEINRIGYIQKETHRGWNRGSGRFRVSPRINRYHIRRITAGLEIESDTDIFTSRYIDRWLGRNPALSPDQQFGTVIETDPEQRHILGGARIVNNLRGSGDILINLLNEMSVSAEYKIFSATELTGSYQGNFLNMSYSTRPLRLGTRYAGILSMNGGTFYNFDRMYVGSQRGFSLNGEGRLSLNMITRLQGGYTHTYDGMDKRDGRYYKLSSNTTWMFTKDFFFRLHAQGIFGTTFYDQERVHNDYLLSGLVSWEYRPGSFLHFAYNEGRSDESNPTLSRYMGFNDRTIVLKISYFLNM